MERLKTFAPYLEQRRNPNMILVPTYNDSPELDVMLAGLPPDDVPVAAALGRRRAMAFNGKPGERTQPTS